MDGQGPVHEGCVGGMVSDWNEVGREGSKSERSLLENKASRSIGAAPSGPPFWPAGTGSAARKS